jgi:hypothetical protein
MLQNIQRTGRATRSHFQHMRTDQDHRGGHIRMPQQFLHSADVSACLQQMCGEAVAQGVHRYRHDDARQLDGLEKVPGFLSSLKLI